MSNVSEEIANDAKFKSGGAIDVSHMLRLGPGDAYVCVAGKPMVGTHMEPLEAYARHLDLHAAPAPRMESVGLVDVVERMLDLHDADERVGCHWDTDAEGLLNQMIEATLALTDVPVSSPEISPDEAGSRYGEDGNAFESAEDVLGLELKRLLEEFDSLLEDDDDQGITLTCTQHAMTLG